MRAIGEAIQAATAGGGFFAGYLWGVIRWSGGAGQSAAPLVRSAVLPGALLAVFYGALFVLLFWPRLPTPGVSGLRAVVFPVVFAVSALAGAFGIHAALWVVG